MVRDSCTMLFHLFYRIPKELLIFCQFHSVNRRDTSQYGNIQACERKAWNALYSYFVKYNEAELGENLENH